MINLLSKVPAVDHLIVGATIRKETLVCLSTMEDAKEIKIIIQLRAPAVITARNLESVKVSTQYRLQG